MVSLVCPCCQVAGSYCPQRLMPLVSWIASWYVPAATTTFVMPPSAEAAAVLMASWTVAYGAVGNPELESEPFGLTNTAVLRSACAWMLNVWEVERPAGSMTGAIQERNRINGVRLKSRVTVAASRMLA